MHYNVFRKNYFRVYLKYSGVSAKASPALFLPFCRLPRCVIYPNTPRTLVVDKIAKSGAMQIYDILSVHLRGVAHVHIWSSLPPKKFFVALDEGITSVAEIPPNSIPSEGYREKTKLDILARTDHSSHSS